VTQEEKDTVKNMRAELQKRRDAHRKVKMILDAEFAYLYTLCQHPGLKYDSFHCAECNICGKVW
jgi:hypothetical protein